MNIRVKRIYEAPEAADGYRLLVDRLWPRGVSKHNARLDAWMRQVAPSTELRRWFAHDVARWHEFRQRYGAELDARQDLVDEILSLARNRPVTLIYSARDADHNQAVALAEYLSAKQSTTRPDIQRLLIAGALTLCFALANPMAAQADSTGRGQDGYAIAGVTLGMDFERVRKIHPAATIEKQAANCYSYGRAIKNSAISRRILRYRDNDAELTIEFAPLGNRSQVYRIYYDRPVDRSTFDFGKLLARVSQRHGSYSRILHRRKLEPAGRIIGFEWQEPNGASLRLVLRNDYRSSSDRTRLSLLARSAAPQPRQILCKLSRCSMCIRR